MAMTPEGRVKEAIKKILKRAPECWWHMTVQNGLGAPSLDFVGSSRGRFFAIEAKAPGQAPTPRQETTIEAIRLAGGRVFVLDGTDGLRPDFSTFFALDVWLHLNP